jgi:hypothetical protein
MPETYGSTVTMTVTSAMAISIDKPFLANQYEKVRMTVNVAAGLIDASYYAYVDFLLPDGVAVSMGNYDYSSGSFEFVMTPTNLITSNDGLVDIQFILATLSGTTKRVVKASKKLRVMVYGSIDAQTGNATEPEPPEEPPVR